MRSSSSEVTGSGSGSDGVGSIGEGGIEWATGRGASGVASGVVFSTEMKSLRSREAGVDVPSEIGGGPPTAPTDTEVSSGLSGRRM
jgi:hypothetical protein